MASIEKKTTKSGQTRYRVRWRAGGRTVEKWRPTLQAARDLKSKIEAEQADGLVIDPKRGARELNDYFNEWLASRLVRGRPLKPGTRYGYERLWKRVVASALGRKQLNAIQPAGVRSWHAAAVKEYGQREAAKAYSSCMRYLRPPRTTS